MAENILEIRHLSKSFGSNEVLRDIDFTVEKGDVISIIGASGSGKSTLLRCINLLETPTGGQILYHGEDVAGRGVNAPKYRSHVGHGVPVVQPLQQHDRAGKLHGRAGQGAHAAAVRRPAPRP